MNGEFSLEELAREVREWCEEHNVVPANGQAADEISERTIRYYRTLGLLDAPAGNYTRSFSEKHRLQLIAIRLFQAQGLPLRRIRDELYGKSLEDLAALEKQAVKRGKSAPAYLNLFKPSPAGENWSVVPLTDEFMLISRLNKPLPRVIIEKMNQLLRSVRAEDETTTEPNRN